MSKVFTAEFKLKTTKLVLDQNYTYFRRCECDERQSISH